MESWDAVLMAQPSWGHFDLGTGYHGDVWLDLDVLLHRPASLRPPVRWLADTAAFLPGYRTPGETAGYHLRPVPGGISGWRVGIVDDAVNAGTAVSACAEALRGQGAVPVAVASLLALGDASTVIPDQLRVPFHPAATLPSHTWPATECPLCTASPSGEAISRATDSARFTYIGLVRGWGGARGPTGRRRCGRGRRSGGRCCRCGP